MKKAIVPVRQTSSAIGKQPMQIPPSRIHSIGPGYICWILDAGLDVVLANLGMRGRQVWSR